MIEEGGEVVQRRFFVYAFLLELRELGAGCHFRFPRVHAWYVVGGECR